MPRGVASARAALARGRRLRRRHSRRRGRRRRQRQTARPLRVRPAWRSARRRPGPRAQPGNLAQREALVAEGRAPGRAPNIGAVALRIESSDAGACIAANEYRRERQRDVDARRSSGRRARGGAGRRRSRPGGTRRAAPARRSARAARPSRRGAEHRRGDTHERERAAPDGREQDQAQVVGGCHGRIMADAGRRPLAISGPRAARSENG